MKMKIPGMEGKTFELLGNGMTFIYMSVCTNVEPEDVERVANMMQPTGIQSPWRLSKDPEFATGQKNPHDCPDGGGCRHYLLSC